MATLPRLKPRVFYDLVVEVALIRPGPIQGGSVHPYIRRRNGIDPVVYDHPSMESALRKTLGVPLFQEQLMQLAVDCAGFSAAEADQLRRAMGSKRSTERMRRLRGRFYDGMRELHGATDEVIDRTYEKLEAFANFGFPESHALSFASLVFYSSWFKLHHPAAFCAALLRAQPMGFYSPQSLVADARRHGVLVHGPDVNASLAHATCENAGTEVRLGSGRRPSYRRRPRRAAGRGAKGQRPVRLSAGPDRPGCSCSVPQTEALATAGALGCFGMSRREGLWAAGAAATQRPDRLPGVGSSSHIPTLPGMSELELAAADVWATGISPDSYPTQFLRADLDAMGVVPADALGVGARRRPGADRRCGDPSAATRDGPGGDVHQPRGRDRDGQRALHAGGVGAAPQAGAHGAGAADPRSGPKRQRRGHRRGRADGPHHLRSARSGLPSPRDFR